MATLQVAPRQTPAERDDDRIEVEVDEDLTVLAATLEDWAVARGEWEFELRLETVFPGERHEEVVAALRRAHPYEEPAFDVYPLL